MTENSVNAGQGAGEHTLIAALEESERDGSEIEIASASGKLADFYNDNNNLDRAEQLYQRAIQLREQQAVIDDKALIVDLGNLATLHIKQRNLDYAELLHQRILTIVRGSDEISDHQKISALTSLASLKRLKGEHHEAVSFYEEALDLATSLEEEPGSLSLMRLKDLGSALIAVGRMEDAEPLLTHALQIAGKVVGEVHPLTGQILSSLETLYRETKRTALADETRARMEAIVENEFERRTHEQSNMRIIDASHHPLANGIAPDWASGWGEDEHGVFVEIMVGDVTQALRWCPPGRFLIGSPEDEDQRHNDEGPLTEITFEAGFWLFETPVTQVFYEAVTGETPSRFAGPDRPVEQVSWDDAKTFLDRINERNPGLDLCLPSEAQWEYACRAGSATPFEPTVARAFSGTSITSGEANYNGNYPYGNAPKGEYRQETVVVKNRPFRPNAWGLWHMHGNVWEWCDDIWSDSHDGASPAGLPRQASRQGGVSYRVVRGGSWFNDAGLCRAAYRFRDAPVIRDDFLGFRPARGQAPGAPAKLAKPPDASRGTGRRAFGPEGAR